MNEKDKAKVKKVLKEYRKKDGLEMRLFCDLMIAERGDIEIVRERLNELEEFIVKAIKHE